MLGVFQLPRIAKPSGTRGLVALKQAEPVFVSTSPDSKAIRNLLLIAPGFVWGLVVSTSPDSKAIRNRALA